MRTPFSQSFILVAVYCLCGFSYTRPAFASYRERSVSVPTQTLHRSSLITDRRLARLRRANTGRFQALSVSDRRNMATSVPPVSQKTGSTDISQASEVTVTTTFDERQQDMLTLINTERVHAGLKQLTLNRLLTTSAQDYADTMRKEGFFSHVDPGGLQPLDRIRETGYLNVPCECTWQYKIGENLARGQETISAAMKDWMNSAGHRENIMNSQFAEVGIGYNGTIWVQHFGKLQNKHTYEANSSSRVR